MKVLGVGCVQFRYADEELLLSDDFRISVFKRAVIDALEGLEQVSNLDYFYVDEEQVGFRSFEPNEDGEVFPVACNFRLKFDLVLPRKVQVSYGSDLVNEHFNVDIAYGYDRPVLYVSFDTEENLEKANPSMAVSVIRKFLEDRVGDKIVCSAIGPSPFHADFRFEYIPDVDFKLIDESEGRSGYSKICIATADDNDPVSLFIYRMNETFSRFYYLVTQRNVLLNDRRALTRETDALLNPSPSSIGDRLSSPFKAAGQIDNIHRSIVSERITRIEVSSYLNEASSSDEVGRNTPLSRYFDEFYQAIESGVWSEFANVANFFEDRRQRLFGNVRAVFERAESVGIPTGAVF